MWFQTLFHVIDCLGVKCILGEDYAWRGHCQGQLSSSSASDSEERGRSEEELSRLGHTYLEGLAERRKFWEFHTRQSAQDTGEINMSRRQGMWSNVFSVARGDDPNPLHIRPFDHFVISLVNKWRSGASQSISSILRGGKYFVCDVVLPNDWLSNVGWLFQVVYPASQKGGSKNQWIQPSIASQYTEITENLRKKPEKNVWFVEHAVSYIGFSINR